MEQWLRRNNNKVEMDRAPTNSYSQTGCCIRFDRDQVSCNNLKGVIVNTEDKSRSRGAVDKPKEMLLARRKFDVGITPRSCSRIMAQAVHDNAICASKVCGCLLEIIRDKRCLMDIILDKKRTQIHVPVSTGWSVDDERSDGTLRAFVSFQVEAFIQNLCLQERFQIIKMVMREPTSAYWRA